MKKVTIIGAGLAGCEAALQLSSYGYEIDLYDAKPENMIPIYKLNSFAELVCNNSIGKKNVEKPLGLLLNELQMVKSKVVGIANECLIEDKYNFSLDKKLFSEKVTEELYKNGVKIINKYITEIPFREPLIIATGPLTNEKLIKNLSKQYELDCFHFSDASSIIININSLILDNPFIKKINNDLYYLKFSDSSLNRFYEGLKKEYNNRRVSDAEEKFIFDKCLSIEKLAFNGKDELIKTRLTHEICDSPCLLMRRENALEDGFILVGCMTTMPQKKQREIFSSLPGFENVEIIKYGRMHRNTFFASPGKLNEFYQIRNTNTYIIGQISGIDGYAPAISSGYVAAMKIIFRDKLAILSRKTMIGGLANYVSNSKVSDFQPMCASFALLENPETTYLHSSVEGIKKHLSNIENLKNNNL